MKLSRLTTLLAAATLALTACASVTVPTNASPRTRVAALSADYLVVQEGIKAYLALPPCVSTALPTCKSPPIVTVLQKGNATASAALDYAEATVVAAGSSASAIDLAISAATEAIKAVKASKTNFGVK